MCFTGVNSWRVKHSKRTLLPIGSLCLNSGPWCTQIPARIYSLSKKIILSGLFQFCIKSNQNDLDNCFVLLCRAFSYLVNAIPDFTDNNLINIIRYGEDYYASSEVNYINKIDPLTLDTLGRVSPNVFIISVVCSTNCISRYFFQFAADKLSFIIFSDELQKPYRPQLGNRTPSLWWWREHVQHGHCHYELWQTKICYFQGARQCLR